MHANKQFKTCPKCHGRFTVPTIKRHIACCNGELKKEPKARKWLKNGKYICPKCNKKYVTIQSVAAHYWRAHTEQGKKHVTTGNTSLKNRKRTPWNKGKSIKNNPELKTKLQAGGMAYGKKIKKGEIVCPLIAYVRSEEGRAKLSKRLTEHNPGGRSKWFVVDGKKVQGTWEREFALCLMENGVKWERCKYWKYKIHGKDKRYTPDFYLPDNNLYIEIKGYWWGNDIEKMECVMEQHPDKNILILEDDNFDVIVKQLIDNK